MTNAELDEISKEIDCISEQVSLLDPNNVIENKKRERLFHRWDFLDHLLDCALVSARRKSLKIVH